MSKDSYRIKRIKFFQRKVPILCQNENGPCPLLAICNILLLQSNISIHPDLSEITFSELTQLVAGFLLDSNPPHDDLRISANQQTQLDAVIKLLPRLQRGLDVNVRFTSIRGFEFTEEMAAFDMTGITLLHGWILDPEDKETAAVISGLSYNKLVEKLLDFRSLLVDQQYSSAQPTDPTVETEKSADEDGNEQEASGATEDAMREKESACGECEVGDEQVPLDQDNAGVMRASADGDCVSAHGVPAASTTVDFEGDADEDSVEVSSTPDASANGSSVTQQDASCRPDQESDTLAAERKRRTSELFREGQVAEEFFRETASQLTYYGLARLHQEVRERQLCVFFRNNHFLSMFKYGGKLYLLITDLGYARESSVVWEKLDQIDGDSEYVDSDFTRSSRCSLTADLPSQVLGSHDDQDYMLALALQQEDAPSMPSAHGTAPVAPSQTHLPGHVDPRGSGVHDGSRVALSDEAVALALHNEERCLFQQRQAATQATAANMSEHQAHLSRIELNRQADTEARALRDRERRRQPEASRGQRSDSGSSCSIQ